MARRRPGGSLWLLLGAIVALAVVLWRFLRRDPTGGKISESTFGEPGTIGGFDQLEGLKRDMAVWAWATGLDGTALTTADPDDCAWGNPAYVAEGWPTPIGPASNPTQLAGQVRAAWQKCGIVRPVQPGEYVATSLAGPGVWPSGNVFRFLPVKGYDQGGHATFNKPFDAEYK